MLCGTSGPGLWSWCSGRPPTHTVWTSPSIQSKTGEREEQGWWGVIFTSPLQCLLSLSSCLEELNILPSPPSCFSPSSSLSLPLSLTFSVLLSLQCLLSFSSCLEELNILPLSPPLPPLPLFPFLSFSLPLSSSLPPRNFQSYTQSVNVLPANERTQLRWNGNPYQLDYGGSDDEMDPGAWLLPYWMARWIGML